MGLTISSFGQQAKGEAVVATQKQPKKNCSRNPSGCNAFSIITRCFGAQLHAHEEDEEAAHEEDEEAAAAAENNKEEACADVARPSPPPPTPVADIVSSMAERVGQAECGATNTPKLEEIVDIDAGDVGNVLAVVEYVKDIYNFYKQEENNTSRRDYMNTQHQPEIKKNMRRVLVEWLMDVHSRSRLSLETLYLTINIIDRFLAVKTVTKWELQLVGVTAMFIASKYEEVLVPQVNDFLLLPDIAYTRQQILGMEKIIIVTLGWNLAVPTPYVFLLRFIKASIPDLMLETMAHFLCELGMMHYATSVKYCPSMVAASAVFAARCTLHKSPVWNETLKLHTGYSEEQLMGCARLLVKFHSTIGNGKHNFLHRIYSDPQNGAVALLPPAKNLLQLAETTP